MQYSYFKQDSRVPPTLRPFVFPTNRTPKSNLPKPSKPIARNSILYQEANQLAVYLLGVMKAAKKKPLLSLFSCVQTSESALYFIVIVSSLNPYSSRCANMNYDHVYKALDHEQVSTGSLSCVERFHLSGAGRLGKNKKGIYLAVQPSKKGFHYALHGKHVVRKIV